MNYRSVEWHTDSNGLLKEIAVEYNRTFWQWLFRKPATQKRWRRRGNNEWWSVLSEDTMASISDPKEVLEIIDAIGYIERQRYLQDLEDRCRKVLHGE